MKTRLPVLYATALAAALTLAACGGGGGGDDNGGVVTPPANNAPTVSGPVTSDATDNDGDYTIDSADLLANASDPDGDTLSVSGLAVVSGNDAGVTVNADSIDVAPAAYDSFAAGDTELIEVSYTVSDGRGGSVDTTAEITISGANDPPSRAAVSDALVADGQPTIGGYRIGTLYADDPEGDGVTFSIGGGADAAVFSVSGDELLIEDGVLAVTTQDVYEVTVAASDGNGGSVDLDLAIRVYASPALNVGYYDVNLNDGRPEQATPIGTIGETAVNVGDFDAADLGNFDMLFVQNPTAAAATGPFASEANQDRVADFVSGGGILIMHDRHVATAESYLPGEPGILIDDIGSTRTEFELVGPPTFVSEGPGGTITDTNLESANSLSFGFGEADETPLGSIGYLSRNDANAWITFAYPFGKGWVIYSSIPLDFYLANGNPEIMRTVYAPNILAQGRALLRKGTDTDGDGLLDVEESLFGSLPDNEDSDGDSMGDLFEVRNGLDPNDPADAGRDPDADGLSSLEEFQGGSLPRVADSDSDGLPDGDEINIYATDPRDTDSDNDLLSDFEEVDSFGTDPNLADTDTGGTDDGREVLVDGTDPLDPGDDLNQADLPRTLNDVNGYIWDIQRDGNINNGTSDAYDGGMRLSIDNVGFPQFATGSLTLDDRQITLGIAEMLGLRVARRIYVPDDEAFVRYLEVLSNPTDADIAVELRIDTNLGSDGNTVIVSTTDGDTAIEATDTWVVTDDTNNGGGDPSLAHVTAGPGAAIPPPVITAPLGRIAYAYDLTVPANGRVIVMHFDSQNANRAAAIASAQDLTGLGNGTLDGLSAEEMADVVNFDLMQPAAVSRPALKVLPPACEAGGSCR